jgi:hypothetical protein
VKYNPCTVKTRRHEEKIRFHINSTIRNNTRCKTEFISTN